MIPKMLFWQHKDMLVSSHCTEGQECIVAPVLCICHFTWKEVQMLQIYIDQYKDAIAKGDNKTARRIERELASVGMDAATLKILLNETKH